jgi:uncharacterized protein YecE (DUF72 family)
MAVRSRPDGKDILIGVGGWAYFPIRRGNKLAICSKLYDYAEVNSTFYKLPPLEQVKKWRATVPESFEFTVKANRELTHLTHLQPVERNFKILGHLTSICNELKATVLQFQFPPSLSVTPELIRHWEQFLRSAGRSKGLHFAFEIRNRTSPASSALRSFFEDHDIIPTVDVSKGETLEMSSDSKILYSRIFGHGEHTRWSFDTEELQNINQKAKVVPARRKYLTFHNFTMYEDASRMRNIVSEGKDNLRTTSRFGEAWRGALIGARLKFPVSREKLIEEIGWRTYDVSPARRFHLSKALETLPRNSNFASLEEALKAHATFQPEYEQERLTNQ